MSTPGLLHPTPFPEEAEGPGDSDTGGAKGAGDGQCNLLSASDLCDEDTLARGMAGDIPGAEICAHPCAQEMIDCTCHTPTPRSFPFRPWPTDIRMRLRLSFLLVECTAFASALRDVVGGLRVGAFD